MPCQWSISLSELSTPMSCYRWVCVRVSIIWPCGEASCVGSLLRPFTFLVTTSWFCAKVSFKGMTGHVLSPPVVTFNEIWVLYGKLTVAQLCNSEFYDRICISPSLYTVLSQKNPAHKLLSHFFKCHFKSIFTYMPTSSQRSLSFIFSH